MVENVQYSREGFAICFNGYDKQAYMYVLFHIHEE